MPTYEYECQSCSHRFEEFQSITEEPLKKCPECGKKVKRLIGTGAGIIFKGSGFYATDHRSSDYNTKSKADCGASCTPDKKAACGKDSKPCCSTDTKK